MLDDYVMNKIKELDKLQQLKKNIIINEISNVIANNIIDDNKIEHLFDDILDLYYWFGDEIDILFNKLYDYYKYINNHITDDYNNYYLELKKENEDEITYN